MYHQSTLPIDKVYSVYSTLGFLGISLNDLDYEKKPLDAYQELTESWIRSRKKLIHRVAQQCSNIYICVPRLHGQPGHITERLATCATGNLDLDQAFYGALRDICRLVSTMESYPTAQDPLTAFFYCANYVSNPKVMKDSAYFQDFVGFFDLMLYPICSDRHRDLVESKSSSDAPDRLLDILVGIVVNMIESSHRRDELRRMWSVILDCKNSKNQAFFIMNSGYVGNAFHSHMYMVLWVVNGGWKTQTVY
ncbi:hypothetical protein CcaCcLH18_12962 [Colletotrichum camelliae]|nr:hypothetical protein CcaCcLH18_12962 [Colletotrichum camelliae]